MNKSGEAQLLLSKRLQGETFYAWYQRTQKQDLLNSSHSCPSTRAKHKVGRGTTCNLKHAECDSKTSPWSTRKSCAENWLVIHWLPSSVLYKNTTQIVLNIFLTLRQTFFFSPCPFQSMLLILQTLISFRGFPSL